LRYLSRAAFSRSSFHVSYLFAFWCCWGSHALPAYSGIVMAQNPMSNAVAEFAKGNPELASRGIGVTTNAERWNGRHAMFGMFFMTFCAYLKGHGLIPDADKLLDPAQWGPLVYGGFGTQITNERAIILIAHIHVLFVSVICAFAPLGFQVRLTHPSSFYVHGGEFFRSNPAKCQAKGSFRILF